MSKAYMVHAVKETLAVEILGKSRNLSLGDVADGCVGVSLWFDTLESAVKWAGKDTKISEANISTPTKEVMDE